MANSFVLLDITVIRANNLPSEDTVSASDPYVEVLLAQTNDRDNRIFTTEEKSNESNPKYTKQKKYLLPAGTCPEEIKFRVIDGDVVKDDLIGITSTKVFQADDQTLPLKDKDGQVIKDATLTVNVNKTDLVNTIITDAIVADMNKIKKDLEENTIADEELKEDVEEVKTDITEIKEAVKAQDVTDKDLADKDKEQDKVDDELQRQINELKKDIMVGFDIKEEETDNYKLNLGTEIKGKIDLLATKKECELFATKKEIESLADKEQVNKLQSRVTELETRLKIVIDGIARIAGKTGGISILYGASDQSGSGQKQSKK